MSAVTGDVLTRRELNRATLARQLLLERSDLPVLDAVEHLVGLQAQEPSDPYTALWSRLDRFRPDELGQLLVDRKVVRIAVMRATIHLVSADDCLVLRPLVQPVLDGELSRHPEFGPALVGVDLDAVMDVARPLLASQPMTGTQLRAAMSERFPDLHPGALAYACRNRLAFVQVPPRGLWGRSGQVTSTTAESWLGRPLDPAPSIDEVVLRYFAAFGPAAVADVTAWSRLTGLREVFDRLRPRLRPFRDERGRELFDLPDAPRPAADTRGPTRFLPMYDNALLSHADRSRFMADDQRKRLGAGPGPVHGSVLYDGVGCATWHIDRDSTGGKATLVVDHLDRLTKRATSALAAEGRRLLRFRARDADTHDVRFAALA
ncbi:MAG: winged helix DNA-binding domain-containing protein [Acidimicrobiales bacterium]